MAESWEDTHQLKERYQNMSTEELMDLWTSAGGYLSEQALMILGSELAGREVAVESLPTPVTPEQREAMAMSVRPWPRLWARTIDYQICGLALALIIGLMAHSRGAGAAPVSTDLTNPITLGVLVALIWLFVETLLLATWGATPGKWLLNVRVRGGDGEKLTLYQSFARSVYVWGRGVGLGLPLVNLITYLISYFRLNKRGITPWDARYECEVSHQKIGGWRVALAVVFLVAIWFAILASFA